MKTTWAVAICFAAWCVSGVAEAGAVNAKSCRLDFPGFEDRGALGFAIEKGLSKEIADAANAMAGPLSRELNWLGSGGLLIRVEVQTRRQEAVTEKRLLSFSALGKGSSPVDAFVVAGTKPVSIKAGGVVSGEEPTDLLDGFQKSESDSFYMWVTKDGDRFRTNCIPFPFSKNLESEGNFDIDNGKIAKQIVAKEKELRFKSAAEAAKRNIDQEGLRNQIANMESKRISALKQLENINASLKKDLEVARKANELTHMLQLMQGVLSVAMEIKDVQETMGSDTPSDIGKAGSAQQIIVILNSTENIYLNKVQDQKRKIGETQSNLSITEDNLRNAYNKGGIPDMSLP